METTQQPAAPVYTAPRGMLGTKIPSLVAFAIGALLFALPFIDIKCNNVSLQKVSGIGLATGFRVKTKADNNSMGGMLNNLNTSDTKTDNDITQKKDPNIYAMVALGLGLLGLLLSLLNARAAVGLALITGIAAAGALIGLMFDINKNMKSDLAATKGGGGGSGVEDWGQQMSNNIKITVDYTPWFYIAIISFLLAAFFSYSRMRKRI